MTISKGGRRAALALLPAMVLPAMVLPAHAQGSAPASAFRDQPLVTSIYTADPSTHVFGGRIYVYPSHDVPADDVPADELGSKYAMRDYRVLEMDRIGAPVKVGPVALDVKDVPWASQQMWAPDAAYRRGTYYLFFPARDKARDKHGLGTFRIGVATAKSPMGPFRAEPEPIPGSFSMDPAVFTDSDGQTYMYFGGISGGQLQRWFSAGPAAASIPMARTPT